MCLNAVGRHTCSTRGSLKSSYGRPCKDCYSLHFIPGFCEVETERNTSKRAPLQVYGWHTDVRCEQGLERACRQLQLSSDFFGNFTLLTVWQRYKGQEICLKIWGWMSYVGLSHWCWQLQQEAEHEHRVLVLYVMLLSDQQFALSCFLALLACPLPTVSPECP